MMMKVRNPLTMLERIGLLLVTALLLAVVAGRLWGSADRPVATPAPVAVPADSLKAAVEVFGPDSTASSKSGKKKQRNAKTKRQASPATPSGPTGLDMPVAPAGSGPAN